MDQTQVDELEKVNVEIVRLKTEIEILRKTIEDINAEKVALDQMLIESLKASLASKKQCLLLDAELKRSKDQILILTQQKDIFEKNLAELKLPAKECNVVDIKEEKNINENKPSF